jgi:hypothetical protein
MERGREKQMMMVMIHTSLLTVGWVREETTEWEVAVSGDGKVLDGQLVQRLLSIGLGAFENGRQGVLGVPGQVDQQSISTALDLKVAEQDVGLEAVQGLVDDVGLVWWRLSRGTLDACLDWQHRHAAQLTCLDFVEGRVVDLQQCTKCTKCSATTVCETSAMPTIQPVMMFPFDGSRELIGNYHTITLPHYYTITLPHNHSNEPSTVIKRQVVGDCIAMQR